VSILFEVTFDKNASDETVKEFLAELNEKAKTDMDAKLQLKQIVTYMEVLQKTSARESKRIPKRLEHAIW
jgi:hypothetical protein